MSTKPGFKKVALFGRDDVSGIKETLQATRDYLKTIQIEIVEIDQQPDLLIVVGGDGSLLQASHMAVAKDIPVLGINRGHLGFLTDIYPDELEKIKAVVSGHYQSEKRFLLQTQVRENKKLISQSVALNEMVLLPGDMAQMIKFEIYINDNFVCSQRADGLIATTPTGSTAYALSGGGPILHPELDAIALVPMFPHKISSRPIVVDDNSFIDILITSKKTTPHISCDGQERVSVPLDATIHIQKYDKKLTLIHPSDYDYYQTLREKLGWEAR